MVFLWYTGCPVKKRLFGYFTTQTLITFFQLIFYAFLFTNCDSCIIWDAFQKKFVHFSTWGPRYLNIREMTWRQKMTFLEDWYLEKWSLERINFYSITSSVPVLKKAPIIRNEKLYPWSWQIFNYLKAPFLTNLNPNSIWCQTL